MISIIAAIDEKRGLGKNNDLLFRIHEDFARLQKLTKGHPIIMGRRTFESIGRVLPGRTNIVITRDLGEFLSSHPEFISGSEMLNQAQHDNDNNKNAIVCVSLEEGIEIAKKSPGGMTPLRQGFEGQGEIFIFGGGQIFKEAIEKDLVDVLHLTVVEGNYNADIFFPDYSMFKEIKRQEISDKDFKYAFLTLTK